MSLSCVGSFFLNSRVLMGLIINLLFKPRFAIRYLIEHNRLFLRILFSSFIGLFYMANFLIVNNSGETHSTLYVILMLSTAGPVLGNALSYLISYFLKLILKFTSIKENFINNHSAVSYSALPLLLAFVFWIPLIFFVKDNIFGSHFNVNISLVLRYAVFVFGFQVVAVFWSLIVFFKMFGEVNHMRAFKSFVLLSSYLIVFVVLLGLLFYLVYFFLFEMVSSFF